MYKAYLINSGARLQIHDADPSSKLKCLGIGKEAVNSIDSFELTMYSDNPGYSSIIPMQTMLEVYRISDNKLCFRGRALKPTNEMTQNGLVSRKFVFESEMSYLWDSIQSYHTANSVSDMFTVMLADHNAQMPDDKKIYPGSITAETGARQHTWHYVKTMQAIQDYISDYGGEIRLRYGADDKMYLDYTDTVFSSGSETKIELAVNMQSISWTVDPTAIASGVYPVGAQLYDDGSSAERLELGEVVWNDELVAKYGKIVAVIEWDNVTIAANLRTKAVQWLANQKGELHQYSIKAVDLSKIDHNFDEFEVGVQYAVKNPLIGLDDVIRCIGKTWDLNDITSDRLTFGDKYETLTALTSTKTKLLSNKIDNVTTEQEAFTKRIVDKQTAIIRGATGGYVYQRLDDNGKPSEILFLNAPSVETATQCLRINQNGIGFWTGTAGGALDGPYDYAWTIDGTFNTDYIVGHTITGFTFDNGNGTFVVSANGEVTASKLTITGGSIHISTNSQTDDVISLSNSEWTNSMSPLESVLTNSTEHTEAKMQAGGVYFSLDSKERAIVSTQGIFIKDANEKNRVTISSSGITIYDTDGATQLTSIDVAGNIYAQHVWGQINS